MEENQVPQTEQEAEALLSSIEGQGSQDTAPPETPDISAQSPQVNTNEFAFTVGGKEVKLDLTKEKDKLIKWAQMGYDAPNRIGQLNQQIEQWKTKESQWGELQKKYGEIDEFVKKTPQFWDHVLKQWEQREQALNQDPNNPLVTQLSELSNKYQTIEQKIATYEKAEAEKRQAQAMQEYTKEFETIKTQYPQLDFSTPDESGKTLEYQVLEHAESNGIKKFTTAFRDLLHDKLKSIHEEGGKEKVIQDKQRNTKLGVLNVSAQPTKQSFANVKGMTHDQIAEQIKSEYNLN